MTFAEIVAIADQHYCDDQVDCVARCFADPDAFNGDLMAAYIVEDLDGVAGSGNDDIEELHMAAGRIDFGIRQLTAVADGFRAEARRRKGAREKSK